MLMVRFANKLKILALLVGTLGAGLSAQAKAPAYGVNCEVLLLKMREGYKDEERGLSRELGELVVPYLRPTQTKPLQVTFDKKGRVLDANKQLVDTANRRFIYVVTKKGKVLLLDRETLVNARHSSMVAGEEVWMAGHLVIDNGVITEVTNASGHYFPSVEHTVVFLRWLAANGADVRSMYISLRGVRRGKTAIKSRLAAEFGIPIRQIFFELDGPNAAAMSTKFFNADQGNGWF
ncbi:MAG TPA: hypothetical protein VM901_09315 [Bdellovibrionota bacterium]|jgi:hypothetical protein|nr:hypothetical protein [Bdellovibrionota bacterium]